MDPILNFLLVAIGTWFGLMLLGSIIQTLRKRAQGLPPPPTPQAASTPPPATAGEVLHPFHYRPDDPEKEQTAEYWWKRLFSGQAVLGVIFIPLQLITLCMNSYVMALRFELLLGQASSPLFAFNVFGWERDITFFDLLGGLISLIQVVAAAVYANREKASGPKFIAAGAWVLLVLVEVLLSVLGTLNSGGGALLASLNGALALGLALADSLFGLYMLELFLIPLVMAVVWTLALPVRVLVKVVWIKSAGLTFGSKPLAAPKPPKQKQRIIAAAIGSLDPFFEPLRNLDAVVGRLLRHLLRKVRNFGFKPKGEMQMSKSNAAKALALLLGLALTLSGCGSGNGPANSSGQSAGISVTPVGAPLHCFLGVDVTPTVSQMEFADYPKIAANSVLACLRPNDRVYLLKINSNAEGDVKTLDVANGKSGLNNEVHKIYESLSAIKQDRSRSITTNLGSFFAHVKLTVNEARKERERLFQQGKTAAPEVRYIVVLLSDGLPDGLQMTDQSAWPENVDVFAFGVKREHEAKFRQLCVGQMKVPEDNLHIKLFSGWTAGVLGFGPAIGRKPDAELLRRLLIGAKSAAATIGG